MAKDVGPTNPGIPATGTNPATGRTQVDYTPALARGQDTSALSGVEETTEGVVAKQYRLISVGEDSVVAIEYDDTNDVGTSVEIAKPFALRKTPFDGETVGSYEYEYETNELRKRIHSTLETVEIQRIDPPYNVGVDLLYAITVAQTGITNVGRIDLNADGRTWITEERILRFTIASQHDDYLLCAPMDANGAISGAAQVKVLKPRELRRTRYDGKTINTIAYTYVSEDVRQATGTSFPLSSIIETQVIIPRYLSGDIIRAAPLIDGFETVESSAQEATYVDINTAGRTWSAN